LGAEPTQWDDRVRAARDAETAHLDAVLKVDGMRYLRLAHVRNLLLEAAPDQAAALEIRADPGTAPQLWLDVAHRLVLADDGETFQLHHLGAQAVETLLATTDAKAAVEAGLKVLAHQAVLTARRQGAASTGRGTGGGWPLATLMYVWLTGAITGIAALTLLSIYRKNLPFLDFFHRYIP
jgi:hypothetical protein